MPTVSKKSLLPRPARRCQVRVDLPREICQDARRAGFTLPKWAAYVTHRYSKACLTALTLSPMQSHMQEVVE